MTREELTARTEKKKVYRIADRFDISTEEAKEFFYARKKARIVDGANLSYHKWKKQHSNFDESMGDVEEGEFDNFFSKKRRRKLASKLRGGVKKLRRINRAVLSGGISELKKKHLSKVRRHKNLLMKMADPRIMSNPRNILKIRGKVKNIVKDLARGNRRLIRHSANPCGGRVQGRPNPFFRRFEGEDTTFLNATGTGYMDKIKKNKWLLIGGGLAFLFLTPMGKKLIGK